MGKQNEINRNPKSRSGLFGNKGGRTKIFGSGRLSGSRVGDSLQHTTKKIGQGLYSLIMLMLILIFLAYSFILKPSFGNKIIERGYEAGRDITHVIVRFLQSNDVEKTIPETERDENGNIKLKEKDQIPD